MLFPSLLMKNIIIIDYISNHNSGYRLNRGWSAARKTPSHRYERRKVRAFLRHPEDVAAEESGSETAF
jgi:hypothetical protein